MSFLDKVEKRIETGIGSVFARLSKAELQPVELTQAIRSTMDQAADAVDKDRVLVPHLYKILVSPTDLPRVTPGILSAVQLEVAKYAAKQGYRLASNLELQVAPDHHVPRGQVKVETPPHPLNVLLANDTLALTGYAVERLADAGGPTLRITFYWQPKAPLAASYKLSLRLQSGSGAALTWPDGNAVVADHFPLRGVAPTTTWLPDEVVADVHYLPLPPTTTGPKQLYVVLYDAATVSEAGTFTIALPPSF